MTVCILMAAYVIIDNMCINMVHELNTNFSHPIEFIE